MAKVRLQAAGPVWKRSDPEAALDPVKVAVMNERYSSGLATVGRDWDRGASTPKSRPNARRGADAAAGRTTQH
eukprot:SAG22_NODE_18291_length_289_cov_1.557895_1_plen_72_part_10